MRIPGSWIFPSCVVATIAVALLVLHWQISGRSRGPFDGMVPVRGAEMSMPFGRRPTDPQVVFKALAEKLKLTPEQRVAIERSIEESRSQGAYPWESVRRAAMHLSDSQRQILEAYRDNARAAAEERNRLRDQEMARAQRPDQYRRLMEKQLDRLRTVAAAPPR